MKRVVKSAPIAHKQTADQLAQEYAHQLTPEALSLARVLVKGCVRSYARYKAAARDVALHDIQEAAAAAATDVVPTSAASTFCLYCKLLWLEDEVAERRWLARTSNDAVDEAFATLNRHGIVALQNAGGTSSMGWAEVNTLIAELEQRHKKALGGVFYHSQDLERGVAGEGLWLTFGARDGSDEGARKIAQLVLHALEAEGVDCEWNGQIDTRIRVLPFEWKKRRTTQPPPRQTPVPRRRFVNPDGQRWEIAGLNNHVCLRITDSDGEVFVRRTPSDDMRHAIDVLIAEQIADGFVEMTL